MADEGPRAESGTQDVLDIENQLPKDALEIDLPAEPEQDSLLVKDEPIYQLPDDNEEQQASAAARNKDATNENKSQKQEDQPAGDNIGEIREDSLNQTQHDKENVALPGPIERPAQEQQDLAAANGMEK